LTAGGDQNLLGGTAALAANRLDHLYDIHTTGDAAEHNVLAIKPGSLGGAEEELRAVGVGTSVGHAENTGASVRQLEVLVRELLAVDALATSAVVSSEVTALAHEAGNDAVEAGALEAKALLASAQSAEVLGSLGGVVEQLHDDLASGLPTDVHLKENLLRHLG